MLQSYVAWYQLISSHPTSCVAVCWRLDGPDPFPQGPPIPQGERVITVPSISWIYRHFPFVILFNLHPCNLYQQGPSHSTGGGGLMGYDHDHGRGGGWGGTRNLEHIYIWFYQAVIRSSVATKPQEWVKIRKMTKLGVELSSTKPCSWTELNLQLICIFCSPGFNVRS